MQPATALRRWLPYLFAFAVPALVVTFMLRPWTYPTEFFFNGGHDWVWQQATFEMHGQVGLWGVTDHIAWPIGANPWRLPQMGGLVGIFAWFTVGVLNMGSASAVLWSLALAAGVNSVAVLYFLRSYTDSSTQVLATVAAIVTGGGAFVIASHINLAFLYAIPLVFAVVARWPQYSRRGRVGLLAVAAVGCALSPLWWVVVLVLLLPMVILTWLLRGDWRGSLPTIAALLATLVGFAFQWLLFATAAATGPGADTTRDPWGANLLGGRMVDLVGAATALERIVPTLYGRLVEGAGMRMTFSIAGLLLCMLALLVLFAMPARKWKTGYDVSFLLAATLMTVLYWLAGGLGNAQAALAAAFDLASPARAFVRMPAVLGIIGAAWAVVLVAERNRRSERPLSSSWIVASGAAVVLAMAWVADVVDLELRRSTIPASVIGVLSKDQNQPEAGSVDFITSSLSACPVAQVPNEGIPVARAEYGFGDAASYRGFIPYIISPEFYWSASSHWEGNETGLSTLPTTFTDAELESLRGLGFCAVLYDKALGVRTQEKGTDIEGREVQFSQPPDYEDDLYSVYLLR